MPCISATASPCISSGWSASTAAGRAFPILDETANSSTAHTAAAPPIATPGTGGGALLPLPAGADDAQVPAPPLARAVAASAGASVALGEGAGVGEGEGAGVGCSVGLGVGGTVGVGVGDAVTHATRALSALPPTPVHAMPVAYGAYARAVDERQNGGDPALGEANHQPPLEEKRKSRAPPDVSFSYTAVAVAVVCLLSEYVPVNEAHSPRWCPITCTCLHSCGVGAGAGVGAPVGVGAGVIWTLVLLLLTSSPPLATFKRHALAWRWLERPTAHAWQRAAA